MPPDNSSYTQQSFANPTSAGKPVASHAEQPNIAPSPYSQPVYAQLIAATREAIDEDKVLKRPARPNPWLITLYCIATIIPLVIIVSLTVTMFFKPLLEAVLFSSFKGQIFALPFSLGLFTIIQFVLAAPALLYLCLQIISAFCYIKAKLPSFVLLTNIFGILVWSAYILANIPILFAVDFFLIHNDWATSRILSVIGLGMCIICAVLSLRLMSAVKQSTRTIKECN